MGFAHAANLAPHAPGRWQFEAFPHASYVQMFGLERIIQYKRKAGRTAAFRIGELNRLRSLMLTRLPAMQPHITLTEQELPAVPDSGGAAFKEVEDQLDAVLCAYVAAWYWHWGTARTDVVGSRDAGYIVVPKRIREEHSGMGIRAVALHPVILKAMPQLIQIGEPPARQVASPAQVGARAAVGPDAEFVTESAIPAKSFYLETFGCQMNAHDSEKIMGTLFAEGYRQVETADDADLVLYNTCSIRDKAEQKVFHRLDEYKFRQKGKRFGVLGCVAQQEGAAIFDKAPHVSLVCGSASYNKLSGMLRDLENGARRVTGLDDRETEECFETEFTARSNQHRGYITIIEGCDKFCAYCVVPYTRGKERSRSSASVLAEARRMADAGFTDIQLLGQNVNSYRDTTGIKSFAELLVAVSEINGIRRVRFTTSHPRDFGKDIVEAMDATPKLCDHIHLPVQSGSTRVLNLMQRLYTREQYLERISWMHAAKRDLSLTTDIIVGFPGETGADFEETLSLMEEVGYDNGFFFKYSPRPNTPAQSMADAVPEEEKSRRLAILQNRQRETQATRNRRHLGAEIEVMVEGLNSAKRQWYGRSSQNKTVNFVAADDFRPMVGSYGSVRVTATFPNSLAGDWVG